MELDIRELLPFLICRGPPLEMKGRVYAGCVRSNMNYGSETRPLLVDVGLKFERTEMQSCYPSLNKENIVLLKLFVLLYMLTIHLF